MTMNPEISTMLDCIDSMIMLYCGVNPRHVQSIHHFVNNIQHASRHHMKLLFVAIDACVLQAKSRVDRIRSDGEKAYTDASQLYFGRRGMSRIGERVLNDEIEPTGELLYRYRDFLVHASRVDSEWRLCTYHILGGNGVFYALERWHQKYMTFDTDDTHIVELYDTEDPARIVKARVSHGDVVANIDGRLVDMIVEVHDDQVPDDDDASVSRYISDVYFITQDDGHFAMLRLVTVETYLRKLQRSWRRFLAMKAAAARIWAIWSRIRCNPHTAIGRKLFFQDIGSLVSENVALKPKSV
jgi:hypothetical protein